MTKEFIPYQEALELKQLDFDEPCFGRFDGRGKNKGKIWYEMPNTGQDSIPVGDVLAPTYSQAFRWFREKYNWSTEIRGANFRASYVIGIPETINYDSLDGFPLVTQWNYVVDDSGVRKTYEEAELACLKKLIEIAKNK